MSDPGGLCCHHAAVGRAGQEWVATNPTASVGTIGGAGNLFPARLWSCLPPLGASGAVREWEL